LHGLDVTELVMEARERELNRRDVRTVAGARYALPAGADFRIDHEFAANEPLLWAADVVAGAVRSHRLGVRAPRILLEPCLFEIAIDTGCGNA
jgi:hypothetical protein